MLSGIACSTQVIPGLAYLCPYLLVILFLIWFFSKTNSLPRPKRWQQTDNLPSVPTMFHHHNKSCSNPVMNQCVIQTCITLPVADPDRVTRFLEPHQNIQFEWIWAKITFFVRVFWLRTQSKFCLDPPLTTTGMLHSPPPPPPPPHLEPHDNMIQYLPICHKSHLYLNRVNLIQCVYIITHEVILFGLLTPSWNESWHTVLPSIKSWNSKYLIQLTQIQL